MKARRLLHLFYSRSNSAVIFFFVVFSLQYLLVKWSSENASKTEEIYNNHIQNITSKAISHNGYKVVYNLGKYSDDITEHDVTKYDVTLVTQCSLNNLHHVIETLERWDGPISLALFSPGFEAVHASIATRLIHHCYQDRDIQIHLVYPTETPPTYNNDHENQLDIWSEYFTDNHNKADCSNLLFTLSNFKGYNYASGRFLYPHNTLRNVAKNAVMTSHQLLLDIDVMPSPGIRNVFVNYLKNEDKLEGKIVYVLPAFEADSKHEIPNSKKSLRKLYNLDDVRQFHVKTCPMCHRPTNYDDWFAVSDDVTVAFQVDWAASWEPFYISTNEIPAHDERFKQYGYDRISQVCELYMDDYEFHVLSNAFVVHRGFKEPGKFHREKDIENKKNFLLYENEFKRDLSIKYSNATWSCSGGKSKREGKSKVSFQGHMKVHQMRFKKSDKVDREL